MQGSNADVKNSQKSKRKRNQIQGSTVPNRVPLKYRGRLQAASDGRGKNYDLKKVIYQRREPLHTKSPTDMPMKPGSNRQPTNNYNHNPPKTIKSSHIELAPNDESKFSSSPVEITPSSSFVTNNFSPSSFVSPFPPPVTESGGEPSGATLDVTGHKSRNEVVQMKRGTPFDVDENSGKDEIVHLGGASANSATGNTKSVEVEDKKGEQIHKFTYGKSKEKNHFGVKIKPKLTEEDISKIRERFVRFQNRSSAPLTKSTFEQEVESTTQSKAPISYHRDSQASVKDQELSKRPKRKLLSGSSSSTLILPQEEYENVDYPAPPPPPQLSQLPPQLPQLPQEEYEYIDYPATPPTPPQSNSPCPDPWKIQCQQRNDTCWVPVIFLISIFYRLMRKGISISRVSLT